MQLVKKTKTHEIFKKRSGRHAVRTTDKKWLKADEKIQILLAEKLIKLSPKKAPAEAPAEAAPTA